MPTRSTAGAPNIERRAGARIVITGYAAVFYNARDKGTEFDFGDPAYGLVERIRPGAFDRAIRERDDARALWNHEADYVLGRVSAGTLRLTTDSRGLIYEILAPDTTAARDLIESLQRGDVTGSSFGFRAERVAWDSTGETDVRWLEQVRLTDVSPVAFPAYTSTTAQVKTEPAGARSWVPPPRPATGPRSWREAELILAEAELDDAALGDRIRLARLEEAEASLRRR